MGVSEKTIENNIKKYLDSLGAYHITIHGSAFMPSGTPDILACLNGRFMGIEVKREKGGVTSPLQKFKINEIRSAGGIAFVARSVNEVKEQLSGHDLI